MTAALSGKYGEYAETLERSSADTEKLKDMLASFGFERAGVKNVDFSLDAEYESRLEDGEYRQKRWRTQGKKPRSWRVRRD